MSNCKMIKLREIRSSVLYSNVKMYDNVHFDELDDKLTTFDRFRSK